jgi:hypothetical protein
LGLPVEFVVFKSAGESVQAVTLARHHIEGASVAPAA